MNLFELTELAMGECSAAHWDDHIRNSFPEEIAHIMAELAEVFEAWRVYKDYDIHWDEKGKPQGVPIEFADVLLGMFYNVGLHGIDIASALKVKHNFNMHRDYRAEGRQLHP